MQVSAAEFVLEGLYAHKRIGRSEERVSPPARSSRSARSERRDDEEQIARQRDVQLDGNATGLPPEHARPHEASTQARKADWTPAASPL